MLNLLLIIIICVLYSNPAYSEGCINTESINSDSSLVNIVVTLKKGVIGNNALKIYKHLYELGRLPCTTISLEDKYPTLSHAVLAMGTLPNRGYPKEADSLFCLLNKNLKCSNKLPAIGSQREITIPSLVYTTTKSVKSIILSENDDPKTDDGLIKILEREEALDPLAPKEERDAILRYVRARNGNFDVPIFEKYSKIDQYYKVMYAPAISAETHLSLPEEDLNSLIKYSKNTISSENIEIKLIGTPKTIKSQATISVSANTADDLKEKKDRWLESIKQLGLGDNWKSKWIADVGKPVESHHVMIIDRYFTSPDPKEDSPSCAFHGDHIAGIIGAKKINEFFEGVASPVDISKYDLSKELVDGKCSDDFYSKYQCNVINYILSNDNIYSHVVNMSFRWDFDSFNTNFGANLRDALQKSKANKLFVVAAGNDSGAQLSSENRLTQLVPLAFYGKDNVIIVSALNKSGSGIYERANRNAINPQLTNNYIVDLLAPGVDIPSTCNGDSLAYLSGTSMATSFVSAAALLLNEEGLLDPRFVKIRLLYTSNLDADFINSVNYGSINVELALRHRSDKFCKGLNDCKSIRRAYLGNNALKDSPPELVEISSSEADSNIIIKESSIHRVSCRIVNSINECTVGYLQSTDSKNKLAGGAKVKIIKHITGLRDFKNGGDLGIVVESGPEKRTYYSLGEFYDFIRRIDTSSIYQSAAD